MPRIEYVTRSFSPGSQRIIDRANEVISEYLQQGFRLTLRQLYYQFVSRDWLPNKQTEYKRLGSIINDARLAGLIDWEAIEDRGRNLSSLSTWGQPSDIVDACANQYRRDLWAGQANRPEVWIEKEALAGVIEPVCNQLRVAFFACKGYVSQSEMWDAGRNRLRGYVKRRQRPVILHLGDHDPSGIDMTRDISERLSMFARGTVEVRRLALNMDQVDEYNPPPNPAKSTDSRFADYVAAHGDESWELDALNPTILADLIRTAVLDLRDEVAWAKALDVEATQRAQLQAVSDRWADVVDLVGTDGEDGDGSDD